MASAPHARVRGVVTGLACLMLAACGGGDPAPGRATLAFRMRGLGPAEEFRVATASPGFIAQARAQLALPPAQRQRFAPAEVSIEPCDGRPSMVVADLGYWLRTVGSFCPWGSYAHAEVQ